MLGVWPQCKWAEETGYLLSGVGTLGSGDKESGREDASLAGPGG